ncbi:MAG: ABC transporter permease [Chloroflexi bacterium]|nr:ABC transporter permease [Chloroflexota bacterium]
MLAVFWKEVSDHMGSRRFLILFAIIGLAGLWATYVAAQSIRSELASNPDSRFVFLRVFTSSSGLLPPFVSFIGFFGPLVGLALGFDAINREMSEGTMSRVLSQPLYRDSVINGKFLAGVATITVMLLSLILIVSGLGLQLIGVPPTQEEMLRLLLFVMTSIIYIAFWLGLAILFSILFRRTATSALGAIALWVFLSFFMVMIAGAAADAAIPVNEGSPPELLVRNANLRQGIMRMSPTTLYDEAIGTIVSPGVRTLGPVLVQQVQGLIPTPLRLSQSLNLVWPQLTTIVALTLVVFAIGYVRFMRQEIRA